MAKKEKKQHRLSGRFAIFFTILLFVCVIIFLNANSSSGSIRRIAYWIFNGVRGDASEATVSFDENEGSRFIALGGNLAIVSPEELCAYKLSGSKLMSEPVLLRNPAVVTLSPRYLAFDLGGRNFYLANSKKILASGECDSKILNANMSNNGGFTITTDSSESKTLVTVYDFSASPIYKFYSSEKYIFDGAVSPNGKTVAVLTYGTEEGRFESSIGFAKIKTDGFYANLSLGTSVPLCLRYNSDGRISVVCNDRYVVCNNNGEIVSEISYEGLTLKAFTDPKNKCLAILLNDYQNGSNYKLLSVNANGELTSSAEIPEDVYSISANGNYISLQYSDKCVVYKSDLSVHCEFMIPNSVNKCSVFRNGNVLLISANSASLYVS